MCLIFFGDTRVKFTILHKEEHNIMRYTKRLRAIYFSEKTSRVKLKTKDPTAESNSPKRQNSHHRIASKSTCKIIKWANPSHTVDEQLTLERFPRNQLSDEAER